MAADRPESRNGDSDTAETQEWLESLDGVLQNSGPERAALLADATPISGQPAGRQHSLHRQHAVHQHDPGRPAAALSRQPRDRAAHQEPGPLERHGHGRARQQARPRHRRPHLDLRLGGHAATKSAFNHFFRGPEAHGGGDQVYFQGHASPGIYARAFLEGRLTHGPAGELSPRTGARAAACRPIRIPG